MRTTLLVMMLLPALCHAQHVTPVQGGDAEVRMRKPARHIDRKGVWVLPSNTNRIYGLALSAWPANIYSDSVQINGVDFDIMPLGIFLSPFIAIARPIMVFTPPDTSELNNSHRHSGGNYYGMFYTRVNGVDLRAIGGLPVDRVDGISVCGLINFCGEQNGFAVSGISNEAEVLNGLQLSIAGNSAQTGRGVQIGLFNRSCDCNCIQIGLLNRNGQSLQPIINWKHRKRGRSNRQTP